MFICSLYFNACLLLYVVLLFSYMLCLLLFFAFCVFCVLLFVSDLLFFCLLFVWFGCVCCCYHYPNSACARGSGGVGRFDCRSVPPAVANFWNWSSSVGPRGLVTELSVGAGAGLNFFWKRKLVLRWIYVRARPHRQAAQNSHTELTHRTHTQNSHTELTHRTRTQNSHTELTHITRMQNLHTELAHRAHTQSSKNCISATLSGWPPLTKSYIIITRTQSSHTELNIFYFGKIVWLAPVTKIIHNHKFITSSS